MKAISIGSARLGALCAVFLSAPMFLFACATGANPGNASFLPSTLPEDRYVDMDGLRLHYTEFPGDGKTVLLVHGFASSTYTWRDVAPLLQKQGFHVIALDLPGFGWSDKPGDRDYGSAALAEDVNRFLEVLGLSGVVYAGNSLGGAVGFQLAARHPEKVSRLAVLDPGVPYMGKMPFVIRLAKLPGAPSLSRLIVNRNLVLSNLRQVFFDQSKVTPRRVDAYVKRLTSPGSPRAQALVARQADMSVLAGPIRAVAGKNIPVLILWGEEDAWIPPASARRLHEDLPGSRLVILPRCGHVPQEEKPKETAEFLADFAAEGSR